MAVGAAEMSCSDALAGHRVVLGMDLFHACVDHNYIVYCYERVLFSLLLLLLLLLPLWLFALLCELAAH